MIFINKMKKLNEKGLASFIVVGIMVILLALISVAFSKLMDRAHNNALNNQLSSAATYAAQSAMRDVGKYLTTQQAQGKSVNNSTCKPQANTYLGQVYTAGKLSGNNDTAKYTCLLVNSTPDDLTYQDVPAGNSQVIKIDPTDANKPIERILFSWGSANGANRKMPPSQLPLNLLDQTTWNQKQYEPMLRATIYPVNAAGDLLKSETYFFYPLDNKACIINYDYIWPEDGTLNAAFTSTACGSGLTFPGTQTNPMPALCEPFGTRTIKSADQDPLDQDANAGFAGTVAYDCMVVIKRINTYAPGAKYIYLRLTPIYSAADVQVKANYDDPDRDKRVVSFQNTQAVIDVTAKDGPAVKRLQSRVNLQNVRNSSNTNPLAIDPTNDDIPEMGVQSATAICKRLKVTGTSIFQEQSGIACSGEAGVSPPPNVDLITETPTITLSDPGILKWTVTPGSASLPIDRCERTVSAGGPNIEPFIGWTDNNSTGTGSNTNIRFTSTGTYKFTLTCWDTAGQSDTGEATIVVNVDAPPPPPTKKCSDGIDNDGNGDPDSQDPQCHSDGDPGNPGTYCPTCDDEGNPPPPPPGGGPPSPGPPSEIVIRHFSVGELIWWGADYSRRCMGDANGNSTNLLQVSDGAGHTWFICSIDIGISQAGATPSQLSCTLFAYDTGKESTTRENLGTWTGSGGTQGAIFQAPTSANGTAKDVSTGQPTWKLGWYGNSVKFNQVGRTVGFDCKSSFNGATKSISQDRCPIYPEDGPNGSPQCPPPGGGGGGGGGGGPGPSCPPGAGGNSCGYSTQGGCDFGDGNIWLLPNNQANRDLCVVVEGGTWGLYCVRSDGAYQSGACNGTRW